MSQPSSIGPGPKHCAHSITRYRKRYSVRSESNGEVYRLPALGRALINTPPNFWACRPTNGSKQIIRVPSVRPSARMLLGRRPFANRSSRAFRTAIRRLIESRVPDQLRLCSQTASMNIRPNKGRAVGRAAGCLPFLGHPPRSPTGTAFAVGCSVLGQNSS